MGASISEQMEGAAREAVGSSLTPQAWDPSSISLARTRRMLREAISDPKIQGRQRRRVRNLLSVADKLAAKERGE